MSVKIFASLALFLGLMTFPFWYNAGKTAAAPEPQLDTPAIRQLAEKQCVETKEYMRASHMQLLRDWRTWVVRRDYRIYAAGNGKEYTMSLQNTCLECHSNKEDFCDRCHDYSGVAPGCWTCHVEPEGENR